MTARRDRGRELGETAPGVVRVRLAGDAFGADVLVEILREHRAVEILTGPDKYDGGRQYLLVRVAAAAEILAQAEGES